MARRLFLTFLASTSLLLLGFMVPLWITISNLVTAQAQSDAVRTVQVLSDVVAQTPTDRLPGVVDARVHTGEPGEEHKETLESAGIAATAGGITSLVLLPDNEPPFDDASLIEFVARRARQVKLTNMYAYGALTVGLEGKQLAEMGLLAEAGAVAFTDADHAVGNAQVLRRALYYAKAFDALIVHLPQEPTLSTGHLTSGEIATRMGLSGNPPLAEVMRSCCCCCCMLVASRG